MFLVFFKKEYLSENLRKAPEIRLNEGMAHENIYKMIKACPEYQKKYNDAFYINLKRALRNYRYFVIDDVTKIEQLNYTFTMELPDDFPIEAILDKKYFNIEKHKNERIQMKLWQVIDQLSHDLKIPLQASDSMIVDTSLYTENNTNGVTDCIPFKKWFKQCRALFFSPNNGYKPLPTSPNDSVENVDANLKIK